MAEVIGLKAARKRKAREQAARQAAENRARFGRTAAPKAQDEEARRRAEDKLDQLRLDPPRGR